MAAAARGPMRVKGHVVDDGVQCSCGRKVGLIHEDGVEFFCRHCNVNVLVDLRESKLEKLAALIQANMRLAEMIAAL